MQNTGILKFLKRLVNVTPTFAQVERSKARKWKKSSENYQKAVMEEELRSKLTQLKHLREEVQNAFKDVREECSFLRFVTIVRTLSILRNKQYIQMMKCHVNKLSCLISKKFDVNEHINNMSSYRLSFFEKLILCRGLKFSLPQKVSPIEIQASFEKAYWRIEPLLHDADEKELANPPKALVKALNRLKKHDNIVITKPDKGFGVVVVDKPEYIPLLSTASVDNTSKFTHVDDK